MYCMTWEVPYSMAAKNKAVSIYPEPALLKKIESQAKEENRGTGPMVIEIVRQWFRSREAAKG